MAKIVRPKEAQSRLGCGHTKFYEDYVHQEGGEENVPGTNVARLRPIPLGLRNTGFLDNELDSLIEGLAALRDRTPERAYPSRPRRLRNERTMDHDEH
jgi:hypothetical protein